MQALVTGAAGFIGSHLSKKLESLGYDLVLIDNFSRGKQKYLDYLGVKTECLNHDLKDIGVSKVWTKDIDVVFHTACRIGGEQFLHGSPQNELSALQENLLIDTNLFKSCLQNNVKKIVYTSSVSVYNTHKQYFGRGVFSEQNLENDFIDPEGGYGWAKFIGEKQLGYMDKMGTKVGVARIFKSYGPCDDYSEESGQVVCSLMRKAIQYPLQPFVVWGDGSVTRNLFYIDDLVEGLIKLSKYKKSLTVNFGGKEEVSIKKLVLLSGKEMKIKHETSKQKTQSPWYRIPDITRAKQKLKWEPKIPLYTGLQKTYQWMQKEFGA